MGPVLVGAPAAAGAPEAAEVVDPALLLRKKLLLLPAPAGMAPDSSAQAKCADVKTLCKQMQCCHKAPVIRTALS